MSDVIVETRVIQVQDGQLEVQMTQLFIDRLRQHFGLFGTQPIDDDHVRMYVWGTVNTAVDKAEREMKDAKPPTRANRVRQTRRRKKDA